MEYYTPIKKNIIPAMEWYIWRAILTQKKQDTVFLCATFPLMNVKGNTNKCEDICTYI